MTRILVGTLLLTGAGAALAEQYNVVASAGPDGDSHGGNNSDPDATASFMHVEGGGSEIYEAFADASSGSVLASALRVEPLPNGSNTTSSAALIEETIHFDELPDQSVTIRARLGVTVLATRKVGFASAHASLELGGCSVSRSYNAVTGATESNSCPGGDTGTIELVLTRDEIIAASGELDISVQVSAQLEASGGLNASATAGGSGSLSRGGGPTPGLVQLSLDPPLAISFTGPNTQFPVLAPEPGAPLLAAAGAAVLCAAGRRRRAG
jgi:hypothetical protein